VAFRRIYGEIAILAAELGTAEAARLGLVVATTAKQTGYAALLRQQHTLMTGRAGKLVEQIVEIEYELDSPLSGQTAIADALKRVTNLRERLVEEISPLLANLVMPQDRTLAQLFDALKGRYALDYLKIIDVYGKTHWFRSLAEPSGAITFEEFDVGPNCTRFLYEDGAEAALSLSMPSVPAGDPIWTGLARELLPSSLRGVLDGEDSAIELVISPHDELGYIPWAALHIDDRQQPLVTAAMVVQTPMLECLAGQDSRQRSGHALICLTGQSLDGSQSGLNITAELAAWRFAKLDDQPPISRCSVRPAGTPAEIAGSLPEILGDAELARSFELAHLAGHGRGNGLAQEVQLPTGRLTAGHALSLSWPRSVILRACHVGKSTDLQQAEPYGMVMALLAGGAQTIVAGLLQISDTGTAELTADIIGRLATGARLEQALREAQLQRTNENVYRWGLLGAYVI
jgi:hypothetical protein